MSRRRELDQHERRLREIGEIMRSMKTLAFRETRKLAGFLEAQYEAVQSIEAAAADFLGFYAGAPPPAAQSAPALLVIGSERGFCGDFNDDLVQALSVTRAGTDAAACTILAVGAKLCSRLDRHPGTVEAFPGPSVAEDVFGVLDGLVRAIGALQRQAGALELTVIHHRHEEDHVVSKPLLPPFTDLPPPPAHAHPPLVQLPPGQFLAELVEHYLFAVLHEMFYTSLMAENQLRIQHLEGAIRRLDEKTTALVRQSRALRQEEITEEIEVLLLSAEGGL